MEETFIFIIEYDAPEYTKFGISKEQALVLDTKKYGSFRLISSFLNKITIELNILDKKYYFYDGVGFLYKYFATEASPKIVINPNFIQVEIPKELVEDILIATGVA